MKRWYLHALALVTLAGCFLDQKEPKPTTEPQSGEILAGIVALEDMDGPGEAAGVFAVFAKKKAATVLPGDSRSARLAAAVSRAAQNSEPVCKFEKADSKTVMAANLVNVGALKFGPAGQSNLITLDLLQDGSYMKKVSPNYPPGFYQIVAEGNSNIKGFATDAFSMPEQLSATSANGQKFETGGTLSKKNNLVLEWSAPTVPNEANYLMFDLIASNSTTKYALRCDALETHFGNTAHPKWEIPASTFAELPAGLQAKVYFVRAHVRNLKGKTIELQTQGLRTYFSVFNIEQ